MMMPSESVSTAGASRPVSCRIIGSGRMAGALAHALRSKPTNNFRLTGIFARSAEKAKSIAGADIGSGDLARIPVSDPETITLLAVSDAALPEVARMLASAGKVPTGLFVHTSGAAGLEPLAPIRKAGGRTGSFHPLQSFTKGADATVFRDISISLLCDEADAPRLSELARTFGARPLRVNARQKKQLHLAAVMASNYMVALLHLAEAAASEISEPLLPHFAPLLQQTLHNVMQQGTAAALTGPVSRGDADTLRSHLAELDAITLEQRNPLVSELIPAYKQLGRVAARLARADGRLSEAQLEALNPLLEH
ncbi:MAG: Rossmann-like and DUF2520 domain-containing protein [Cyclonatronaceae bacterium]